VYTIDASIFGNAVFRDEAGHVSSRDLLSTVQTDEVPLVLPTLVLPEVAALIARRTGSQDLADRFIGSLRALPYITWASLTPKFAAVAASIASQQRLRGADAVYIAVSLRYNSTLVTRDQEQLSRAPDGIRVTTPEIVLRGGV
jgi:predicted nucleic acid-binding protein